MSFWEKPTPMSLGNTAKNTQPGPVFFAVFPKDIGVGFSQNDIDQLRKLPNQLRESLDDRLNPFVRTEQSKGQQRLLPFHLKTFFIMAVIKRGKIGSPVIKHPDFFGRHSVNLF